MKKSLIVVFFLGYLLHPSFAQKHKDYILTLNQDTLFGQILLEKDNAPITFKFQQKKVSYHPTTLPAFGIFEEDQYIQYKSLKSLGGKAVFVQIMTEGPLKLYKYREKHEFPNSTLERYVYFIGYADQNLITASSSSYKRIVGQFFDNYPDFMKKLNACSFDEVPNIILGFNQLVTSN